MKLLCIFLFLILCLNTAYAYSEDDLEWASSNSKKLHLNDTITNGNFTVILNDFTRSSQKEEKCIGITLYEMGIPVADQTFADNEDYIYNDSIRITVTEISIPETEWATSLPDESYAEIKMESRGIPSFDVKFETDKEDYSAYSSQIKIDLTIQNTGDAKADDVDVYITAKGLELMTDDHYQYDEIEKGVRIDYKADTVEFDPVPLRFDVPYVIVDTVFNVLVEIKYTDITGMKYYCSESYPVKVSGSFGISKSINDNIYIDEAAIVTISLINDGSYPINDITISDSIPQNFELNENCSLEWELDLNSGECRSITYTLLPLKPGEEEYTVPSVSAQWTNDGKTYSACSNTASIAVYGPKIELLKSANPETVDRGGTVSVTVEVKNTGNVLATVDVNDSLPLSAELIDGVLKDNMVLRGGESQIFSYDMKLDISDSMELPCAVAHFVDAQEYDGSVVSNIIVIKSAAAAAAEEKSRSEQVSNSTDESIKEGTAAGNTGEDSEDASIGWVCIAAGFFAAVIIINAFKR